MPTKRAVFLHSVVLGITVLLLTVVKSTWHVRLQVFAQYPTPTDTPKPSNTLSPTPTPFGAIIIDDPTLIHDSFVHSESPTQNFGIESFIRTKTDSPTFNSYLKFTVSGISGSVSSATLRLYVTDASVDAGDVYSVSNNYLGTSTSWVETGINWNNAPAIGGTALDSGGPASLGQWVEFNVTSAITGNGTFSFGIITTSTNAAWFSSSEASSNRPQLVIIPQLPPTITPTRTPTRTPAPTSFQIYGYAYRESNNNANRPLSGTELSNLMSGYQINLSGDSTANTTSIGANITPYLANYLFTQIQNGIYQVAMQVTPTRSVLFNPQNYTNPQVAIVAGGPVIVDFPFVTITPTFPPGTLTPTLPGGGLDTPTPTPTDVVLTPTSEPTPTSILTPPVACGELPTPILAQPAHELCTNSRPPFSAMVEDPNGDNVWAHFYSNSFEGFDDIGESVVGSGESIWNPGGHVLNSEGGYWWTAYTETSSCGRSEDAPAKLITMDFTPPPAPGAPTCTLINQNYITGETTFECSWDEVEITDGCGNTVSYYPYFWTQPGNQVWEPPGGVGDDTSTTVVTEDGVELYAVVEVRDAAGNRSSSSPVSIGVAAPKINFSSSPTPGGPTSTPSPSPTITPTPTLGPWMQVRGGDVYQPNINQPIPPGQYFLDLLPTPAANPNSAGLIWSQFGGVNLGFGVSSPIDWQVKGPLSNAFNFTYYWEAFKNQAKTVDNSEVGIIDSQVEPTSAPTPVILSPIADTHARSANPTNNYCNVDLSVNSNRITFLKFDLSSLAGSSITSAKLYLKVSTASTATQSVKSVTDTSWVECSLNFNNQPTLGGQIGNSNAGTLNNYISIDITSHIDSNLGNIITLAVDSTSSQITDYYSKEDASSDRPYLEIIQ